MARARREEQREQDGRNRRVPLGTPRTKLTFTGKEPGYVYRVVNDDPGRLQAAVNGGYEFVVDEKSVLGEDVENTREMGAKVTRNVGGLNQQGQPRKGYLMKIRQDWYDEDQQAKQDAIDEKEKATKQGNPDDGGFGSDGRYIPNEGIKMENTLERKQ